MAAAAPHITSKLQAGRKLKEQGHCLSLICLQSNITYTWNLKNSTNESVRNRLTDIENKLIVTKGERGPRGIN